MVDVSGVPKITSVIDNITALTAEQLEQGGRYEVVLDHVDGDHHELELHFRLVELTATRKLEPSGVHYAGGLEGAGPHTALIRKRGVSPVRLAKLLASIISLSKISPRVLGIPDGEGPEYKRVLDYLSGDDAG